MKKLLKNLMMVAALVCGTMSMTSCDEIMETIFGEWDKPTPQSSTPDSTPTPEEMLTNLSAALEEGALVSITYTVDGVTYTSTFKKVGDEYVEQSTTNATRALTRGGAIEVRAKIQYMPSTAVFNFQVNKDNKVVLNLELSRWDCTYAQTFNDGAVLKGVTVNGQKASLTNANDKAVSINKGDDNLGSIGCKAGETWSDYVGKQSNNGHKVIQTDDDGGVLYSNGGVTGQLYKDADCTSLVLSGDEITKDVYVNVETTPYLAASWDATEKKVVYTEVPLDKYTLVSPSDGDVTWSGGTYVVKDDVTIGGRLELMGNVNLILCNGAKLTVNGKIAGNTQSLTIYSQSHGAGAGNLEVKACLDHFFYLTIHGGNITVESGIDGINNSPLTVYGGIVSITSKIHAIYTGHDNNMNVYGGEVNAISESYIGISLSKGNGTLTVYGGKVTAQGGEYKGTQSPAIEGYFAAGEGTNIGFFESNDGNTWSAITGNSADKPYFKAEPATAPATIAVTGVSLDQTSLDLTVGGTATLKATVAPLDATNQDVTWESNNTAAATVDQNGAVKAVGVGEATITVTTKDGSKTATCKVTVKAATVAVTGVSLNKASLNMKVGDSETLVATVAPTTATNQAVTWSSNKTSVATVDANGQVTAIAAGKATITVTTKDGTKTAECSITVDGDTTVNPGGGYKEGGEI